MSATYRIDIEHKPQNEQYKYIGHIHRISDGFYLETVGGRDADEALAAAQAKVQALNTAQEPYAVYVDDEGRIADEPHSVKV